MTRFTIYTYLFKPINEPQEPDMFSPLVKRWQGTGTCLVLLPPLQEQTARAAFV